MGLACTAFLVFLIILDKISMKKLGKILSYIILIYLMVLMGANTQNPDTYIYETSIYKSGTLFTKDIGFGILVLIFNKLGLSYYTFKMIISCIGIILIHKTVRVYLTKNVNVFYFLYVCYPFFMDIVQVRNFLAMAIFIYSTRWLTIEKNNWKYIFGMVIAISIQKTALAYLPLCFFIDLDKDSWVKRILYIVILITTIIGLNRDLLINFMNFLLNYVAEILPGLERKLLTITTNYGWILFWGIQVFNYYIVKKSKKYMEELDNSEKIENYEVKYRFLTVVNNLNIYTFLFLPLYIITSTFSRIQRNIYILNFIAVLLASETSDNKNNKKLKNMINLSYIMIAFYMLLFIYRFLINNESALWNSIIIPVYQKNWIFELFKLKM